MTCTVSKKFSGCLAKWIIRSGALLYALSLACIIALQYRMPDNMFSCWGMHPESVRFFESMLLGWHPPQLSSNVFSTYLIFCLLAIWAGYGLLLYSMLRGFTPKIHVLVGIVALCALAVAFLWPVSLSFDPYAYVATGRLKIFHGLNPYMYPGNYVAKLHDEVARFECGAIPTPYGPVWTALSMAVVWLLKGSGVWWQVVAMKLIAAAALIAAALSGRWIAEKVRPGTGAVSLLAIGLNPLLLIEGPGNGHNDLFMIAVFMVAIIFLLKKRFVAGALFLGISIGVKFVTVVALPWLIWEYCRGTGIKKGVSRAAAMCLAVIVPSLICYLLFWDVSSLGSKVWSQAAWCFSGCRTVAMHDRGTSVNLSYIVAKHAPLILMYAVLSIWCFLGKRRMRWLTSWVIISVALVFTITRCPFPWYISWALVPALVEWGGNRRMLSWMCMGIGAILMIFYAVPG